MNSKVLGLLAASLLAGPMAANAVPVTWSISGQIKTAGGESGPPYFPTAVVGDAFHVLFSFDSDAALIRTRSGGTDTPGVRYEFDPTSLQFSVRVGAEGPIDFAYDSTQEFGGFFYLLDNTGRYTGGTPWDGLSLGINGGDSGQEFVGLALRGGILDIVNGPALPRTPDPRLVDLDETFFQILRGTEVLVGEITSVRISQATVPEPGTLALLGLGLTGLALSRRRKPH